MLSGGGERKRGGGGGGELLLYITQGRKRTDVATADLAGNTKYLL